MDKYNKFKTDIKKFYSNDISINISPSTSFRSRCEFGYKNNSYTMYDNKSKVYLDIFQNASLPIQKIMPILLNKINKSELLNKKLFQINFRSNIDEDILITLIYHKELRNEIKDSIKILQNKILKFNTKIILRAKNEIYPNKDIYFQDNIKLVNSQRNIIIYQTDNCFYQPNKFLLSKMIDKVITYTNNNHKEDLIELYCGVGTFSLPLSDFFNKIFVTENNRSSIKCLIKGLSDNKINNVEYARLSSSEVVELFAGRTFNRMKNNEIKNYNFSHILVDPPRSGLTNDVIKLINSFKNIIYISCNPETYLRDIKLLNNHKIINIELFDQFPNTNHLEIVSLLSIN